jgi:uncharacterized protein YqhQ
MPCIPHFAKLWARSLLLPSLQSNDDPLIGGQAVMEGVMMRTPQSYCVAVRKASGEIVTKEEAATRLSQRSRFWALPIARGCGVLGQSMALGMKALNFSAEQAVETEPEDEDRKNAELPGWALWLNIAISLGFFIVMYKFLPLVATRQLQEWQPVLDNQVGFSFVEGGIRLAIFLTFLFALSKMKDIRRVFEYHGAEHKVVFNYESGQDLSVENAQRFLTWHPRCGTSFLMVVMLVAIAAYAMVPFEGFGTQFVTRIALLPLIAGVSYEIIRYTAKRQSGAFMLMARPGLWLQRITTKQPDDNQVEVAILALRNALDFERRIGGQPVVA